MEKTLEQALAEEFLKKLRERQQNQKEHLTSQVLERDDYVQRVGYLWATRELEEDFLQLLKVFFPT